MLGGEDDSMTTLCSATWEYAVLSLLLVAASIPVAANLGWHYEYKQGEKVYYVMEGHRLTQLIEISLHETSNPFNPWDRILVEPCADLERAEDRRSSGPCWPREQSERTQELLATLATKMPEYRDVSKLTEAGAYVNRGIGAFHPAWIIGTCPLTVAFRQGTADPDPYADLAKRGVTTRPTATPGLIELVGRSGTTSLYDRRARKVDLVTDADLKNEVDVLLVFPKEMLLPSGELPFKSSSQPSPPLKVFHLREPIPLDALMRELTDLVRLEQKARAVENIPVRPPP